MRHNYSSPSVARLEAAFPGKGKELKRLLSGKVLPGTYPAVESWLRKCHNPPRWEEQVMLAVSEVIEGYGVEDAESSNTWISYYHQHFVFDYVNMGDTYDVTIVLDHRLNRFRLTSWGDYVEYLEGKGVMFA